MVNPRDIAGERRRRRRRKRRRRRRRRSRTTTTTTTTTTTATATATTTTTTTTTTTANIAYDVYEVFLRKEQTQAIAGDLEDAYNSVRFTMRMKLLVQYVFTLMLTRWLTAAIQERSPHDLGIGSPRFTNRQWDFHKVLPCPQSSTFVYAKGLAGLNISGLNRVLTHADHGLPTKQPVTPPQQSPLPENSWEKCYSDAERQGSKSIK